ncbi:mechanosensitive ion channel family protein [Frateuria hangzhouensis]|uniref:mechanosensitive ion channel family protein n=1 Tax=Frateuria hangzhouensis TaxID=2995589 RepID=UPI002260A73C|nr:mechanosensitive ion channel family protein [Frateuria sp. STR12]MCX7514104.1 mechanosensitive ion channel family protein [Frateuria sp. STR12]
MTDKAVREVERRADVRHALATSTATHHRQKRSMGSRHKFWLGIFGLVLIALTVLFYLLRLEFFGILGRYLPMARRATVGAMAIVLTLAASRLVQAFAIERAQTAVTRYNLKRILRLVVYMVLALIVVSVLFANWYAAVASLGLISLVLGFALQTPITSFIGWVYILVREPYRVGDRIQIGDATGDVIDVTYLDTTLWEVGGPYISTDHPSGRIVKFPNANVLTSAVYNYSWPVFPYIWNEINFQVGYDSDFAFVEQVMREAAEEELGEAMLGRVRTFREVLARTPVDELQVNERPSVLFRINTNTWVDAIVRYVVEPRHAGSVKTRLIDTMLARLNAQPERVRFPKGDNR